MKKKIIISTILVLFTLVLSGCSLTSEKLKEEEKKVYEGPKLEKYTREQLALGNMYIKNGDDYYKALTEFDCRLDDNNVPSLNRKLFLSDNDILVPTLYNDDILLYYTSEEIPASYQFEYFSDEGYTIGLFNIIPSSTITSKYFFSNSLDYVIYGSDFNNAMLNFEDNAKFILSKFNGKEIQNSQLTQSGTIKDLIYGKTYSVEYYLGSQYYKNDVKADIHAFISSKLFTSEKFKLTEDSVLKITPPNLPNGYYLINNAFLIKRYNGKRTDGIAEGSNNNVGEMEEEGKKEENIEEDIKENTKDTKKKEDK